MINLIVIDIRLTWCKFGVIGQGVIVKMIIHFNNKSLYTTTIFYCSFL